MNVCYMHVFYEVRCFLDVVVVNGILEAGMNCCKAKRTREQDCCD